MSEENDVRQFTVIPAQPDWYQIIRTTEQHDGEPECWREAVIAWEIETCCTEDGNPQSFTKPITVHPEGFIDPHDYYQLAQRGYEYVLFRLPGNMQHTWEAQAGV